MHFLLSRLRKNVEDELPDAIYLDKGQSYFFHLYLLPSVGKSITDQEYELGYHVSDPQLIEVSISKTMDYVQNRLEFQVIFESEFTLD
jgi:hypothetical protein